MMMSLYVRFLFTSRAERGAKVFEFVLVYGSSDVLEEELEGVDVMNHEQRLMQHFVAV